MSIRLYTGFGSSFLLVDGRSTTLSLVKLRSTKRRILLPFLIEIFIPCCAKHCEIAVESNFGVSVFFFNIIKIKQYLSCQGNSWLNIL